MKLRIPCYVEGTNNPPCYRVSPLFEDLLARRLMLESPLLEKALRQIHQGLLKWVEEFRRDRQLSALTRLSYHPPLREHVLDLSCEYKKRTVKGRLLVVTCEALGQQLAYCPALNGLWFSAGPLDRLERRAAEVFIEWLREQERDGQPYDPEKLLLPPSSRAWLHYVQLEVDAPGIVAPPPPQSLLAILGGEEQLSGAEELARVGRHLNRAVAERPEVFLGREQELDELMNWSQQSSRSGFLIVGPRLCGKSALLRAHVQQQRSLHRPARERGQRRQPPGPIQRAYWMLSPGRLISGMSYLGQWENRLLSILRHLRGRDHVLVFDDLIGLLSAGVSRDSSFSVAQMLKSFLDRGELRVLAEITPEAYQILRERDPGLAAHFQPLYLEPTSAGLTRRIALTSARQSEESQSCRLSLEAIHTCLLIADRYLTDSARPGKVTSLIQQLAAHHRQQEIGEAEVLSWFARHAGLSERLLEQRKTLTASEVRSSLEEQLVGQENALTTCVEVVLMTRARLQSQPRPQASLLMIGPTGVGKTECAKALAHTLYGHHDRLLRFDMNEYLGDDSVARLVGTFHRPEGTLTEAVRSQPFSVVLLDEIEKAHPQVLLLLLQILGDGRLSDARGRTVDFSQTVVVMTSNLGAQQLSKSLGLRKRREQEELIFRRAAEEFFPPELFNRIDRVVPFQRLSRAHVARIAERLWQRLLGREGLRRRQCLLEVSPQAHDRVVSEGFHPDLGARALKRAVEEKIVGPVARRLAALPVEGLTLLRVDDELQVTVAPLKRVPSRPLAFPAATRIVLERLEQLLSELERQWKPAEQSAYSHDELSESHLLYFEAREELRSLRQTLLSRESRSRPAARSKSQKTSCLHAIAPERVEEMLGQEDLYGTMQSLALGQMGDDKANLLLQGWLQLAWLGARLGSSEQQAVLCLSGHQSLLKTLSRSYHEGWEACDIAVSADRPERLELRGPALDRILPQEMGLHIFLQRGNLFTVWAHPPGQEAPLRIVRVYIHNGPTLDLASSLLCAKGCPMSVYLRAHVAERLNS